MESDFTKHDWQVSYRTSELNENGEPTDILHDFYIPALKMAVRYDRVAGYFRSTSLAAASQGFSSFLENGGHMRMIVGADMQVQDIKAILEGNKKKLSDELMKELEGEDKWPEEVKSGVSLLSRMVASGQLEVKVAFRINAETKEPITADSTEDGYVHEKWLIMYDSLGNRISGSGSLNESRTALVLNAENIDVSCDWDGKRDRQRTDKAENDFNALWEKRNPHMKVMDIPEAVKDRLIKLKDLTGRPVEIDGTIFRDDIRPSAMDMLRFAVLKDAPKMPGGIYVGMYSAPVEPWPHQEIVSRRLVESWPYSYMLCDEVGLGKTIEAALAMRSLILSGWARRILVIAPKSLTDQWQRELASKAMLSFCMTKVRPGQSDRMDHAQIYPEENVYTDDELYSPCYGIISSGLVWRSNRIRDLNAAEGFDVVLVDEAHYARRKNPQDGSKANPDYGNLYKVIYRHVLKKAKSLWMATATPMQIDPVEAYDLFRLAGRSGPFLSDPTLSLQYFAMVEAIAAGMDISEKSWSVLGKSFRQLIALDPYLEETLEKTVITRKNERVIKELDIKKPKKADIRYLKQPIFAASPLSRVMMRHTRALLEIYRDKGELKSNLAKRKVRPVCTVEFTEEEKKFYDLLEEYCRGLGSMVRLNEKRRQTTSFLLSFVRLRFASSVYAIHQTLIRRLERVNKTLIMGARIFETQEELEEAVAELKSIEELGFSEEQVVEYSEDDLSEITIDAMLKDRTKDDLIWEKGKLREMLGVLEAMTGTPSKIRVLMGEIERRRYGNRVRQTVIFTRFYDSLKSIRSHLSVCAPDLRIGVFSGQHAEYYDVTEHADVATRHEHIKDLFLAGEIDILLCTDAAAEGLNLQTADLIINFDLGWNPMKVEQRIGRIDRIGQKYDTVEVMNMCYLGSEEEKVYGKLFDRLRSAESVVGIQQISMLPVTPEEFYKLSTGEIDPDVLEQNSIKKLEEQKRSARSMELPAEEIYQLYKKQSEQMKNAAIPARLEDIRDALLNSTYLKEYGIEEKDGIITIPANDGIGRFCGTIRRDITQDGCRFITWGNPRFDRLLEDISENVEEGGCVKRITAEKDGIEYVGYAVATEDGIRLITAYGDIDGLVIDEEHRISKEEEEECKERFLTLCVPEWRAMNIRKGTVETNMEFASLHEELVYRVAIQILEDLKDAGFVKMTDALKELQEMDNDTKTRYSIPLPEKFRDKKQKLLFPVIDTPAFPIVIAEGLLLTSAVELVMRMMNTRKKTKRNVETVEIINSLKSKI